MFSAIIQHFSKQTPVGMMVQGLLERALPTDEIEEIFAANATVQYERKLLFTNIVELMSVVVCRIRPSISSAIKNWHEKLPAERKAIYEKINHTEPQLGQKLVQHSAQKLAPLIDAMPARQAPLVSGYRTRILDGNHHAATDHRLKILRDTTAGPLPGFSLVVYEPELDLVTHHFPYEDGHESERKQLDEVLKIVAENDLWIADRNFGTTRFLSGFIARNAAFVIRDHATNAPWKEATAWQPCGRCSTGEVYEQSVQLLLSDGSYSTTRRIKIVLDKPIRQGDQELYLLSNLPATVSAITIAEVYRKRWSIETGFQDIEANLRSEIPTLNQPLAALFVFAVALVAFNIYRTVKNVIRAEHGDAAAEALSGYDVANEVAGTHRAVEMGIPPEYWQTLRSYSLLEFVGWLREMARQIPLARFRKFKQYPKKTKKKPVHNPNEPHISTYRKLEEAKKSRSAT